MKKVLRLFLLLLVFGSTLQAQTIDPSFRPAEIGVIGSVKALATYPDNSFIALGGFEMADGALVENIVRYTSAGQPDPGFQVTVPTATLPLVWHIKPMANGGVLLVGNGLLNIGGHTAYDLMVLQPNGQPNRSFNSQYLIDDPVAVPQPDGRIVVAGYMRPISGTVPSQRLVVRLNADGTLDNTFTRNTSLASVNSLALQPDGKVLVGGSFPQFAGSPANGLVRLNVDGTLDATFTVPNSLNVQELLVQPDGKILVGGPATNQAGTGTGNVLRLLPTGAVDASFTPISLPGRVLHTLPYYTVDNPRLTLLPDGKLVVGWVPASGSGNSVVQRYLPSGISDSNWQAAPGPNGIVQTVESLPNGAALVGGSFRLYNQQAGCLAALVGPTGTISPVLKPGLFGFGSINSIAQQPDGKLLIAGEFNVVNSWTANSIARLLPNGEVDTTFRIAQVPDGSVLTIAALPNGQVVVGGSFNTVGGQAKRGVARYSATGALDVGFTVPFPAALNSLVVVQTLKVLASGNLLVGGSFGYTTSSGNFSYIGRVLPSGAFDATFTPDAQILNGQVFDAQELLSGNILVVGNWYSTRPEVVRRLLPNGMLDPTFNIVLPVSGGVGKALALLPNGGFLLAGSFSGINGRATPNLARLNANGTSDINFVSGLQNVPPSNRGATNALAVQADGRILAGGQLGAATLYLHRLLTDGTIDPSYFAGSNSGPDQEVTSLLMLPNDVVLVGGRFKRVGAILQPALVRLLPAAPTAARNATRRVPGIELWPNPAQSILHIRPDAADQPRQLILTDALGKVVISQKIEGAQNPTVSVRRLPAGVYLLRVDYADGPVTRRVVVQ